MQLQLIQNRIYEVRNEKVMLDFNLAVKRNIDSFPKDFMFQLNAKEWKEISSSQFVMTTVPDKNNSSQIVMSSIKHRGAKYLPYAFTEHGVAMLASVLKSSKARTMNIVIARAFIALRKLALQNNNLVEVMKNLKDRIDEHDVQLKTIYDSIENLLDEKVAAKNWF